MIKLTELTYTIKASALEIFHNISENAQSKVITWEKENERAENTGEDYFPKPFFEPFEYMLEDYDVVESPLRVNKDEIKVVRRDKFGTVEILYEGEFYAVKESIEEMDILLGID